MIDGEVSARAYVARLCNAAALDRLDRLVAALRVENARQNLVSPGTLDSIWRRHLADSAQLLAFASDDAEPWLDLGTGAGFPGLVVAAMRPERRVILVESRRKRIDWLERMRAELSLPYCRIEGRRLELVETFRAGVISARAFAPLTRLLDLAERFSTSDTVWLLPKGRSAEQELRDLPKKRRGLFHVEQSATDPAAKILVGRGGKEATST